MLGNLYTICYVELNHQVKNIKSTMEQDRYQKNHKLFIVGLLSLILGLSLVAFSLFILPNLFFGWHYDVPEFIANWVAWLQDAYELSSTAASKLTFFFFFLLGLFFAVIAYFSSNRIDNQIYSSELEISKPVESKKGSQGTLRLVLQILFIVWLVFIVAKSL